MILDIDHFKEVNDKHGHVAGDDVLKVFAHRLQDNLRSFDMVARLGGEEFVVVLPDTTPHMTYFIAERLRRAVADKPVKCSVPEGEISISTSIGGAVIEPGDYEVQEILDRVDKFLYEAKNGGRNCCIFESVGRLNPEEYMQSPREVGK